MPFLDMVQNCLKLKMANAKCAAQQWFIRSQRIDTDSVYVHFHHRRDQPPLAAPLSSVKNTPQHGITSAFARSYTGGSFVLYFKSQMCVVCILRSKSLKSSMVSSLNIFHVTSECTNVTKQKSNEKTEISEALCLH